MTRFDLDMDGTLEPSEHGHWVRYEDATQRTWVGLTDEEIDQLVGKFRDAPVNLTFAIEAKLKEKNT